MKRYIAIAIVAAVAGLQLGCGSTDNSSTGTSTASGTTPQAGAGANGASTASTTGANAGAGETGATVAAGVAGAGGSMSGSTPAEPKDIVDTAVAAGSFTQLAKALTTAGLVDALKGVGPFTVFAPTDDAFAAFEQKNPGVLSGLSVEELGAVLKYHVVSGASVKSTALKNGQVVTTLNGAPALIDLSGSSPKIDDATVVKADVVAKNGVIHVIDTIILPPKDDLVATVVAASSFKTLAKALTDAGLVSALQAPGPFTVFAPTDDAFAALSAVPTGDGLKDVLLYHVVKGSVGSGDLAAVSVATLLTGKSVTVKLMPAAQIDDANIVKANILTKNGVIHVIDKVLVPK